MFTCGFASNQNKACDGVSVCVRDAIVGWLCADVGQRESLGRVVTELCARLCWECVKTAADIFMRV